MARRTKQFFDTELNLIENLIEHVENWQDLIGTKEAEQVVKVYKKQLTARIAKIDPEYVNAA